MAKKYGEIKVQTESGVKVLPIYELGSSGTDVSEFVRVETGKGTGYIPVASTSKSVSYPFIRVKTDSGSMAFHNLPTLQKLIDDFEGDINGWYGNKGSFYTTNTYSSSGSYSLTSSVSDNGNAIITDSDGDFPTVSQGDRFKLETMFRTSGNQWTVYFGLQSETSSTYPDDGYKITVETYNDKVKIDNGNTTLESKNFNIPRDEWLEWDVRWKNDGQIVLNIYDSGGNPLVENLTATDTTYTSGGWGIVANRWYTGEFKSYLDNIRKV